MKISMDIKNLEKGLKRLLDLEKSFDNIDDVKEEIGIYLLTRTRENFQDTKSPFGELWKPLKNPRPNGGIDDKPLNDSGDLRRSVDYEVIGDDVRLFAFEPYASYHNEGTDDIPQRQFMPIDELPDDYIEDISNLIINRINKIR